MSMKKLFAVLVIAAASIATVSTADAAAGCGPGWHRDFWGHCVRNRAAVVVAAPGGAVVVGRACPRHWHWSGYWGHCVHN
jgi:hypothetical protein